jgi:hypothetical protein
MVGSYLTIIGWITFSLFWSWRESSLQRKVEYLAQATKMDWDMLIWEKLDKNQISEEKAQTALETSVPTGDLSPQNIVG